MLLVNAACVYGRVFKLPLTIDRGPLFLVGRDVTGPAGWGLVTDGGGQTRKILRRQICRYLGKLAACCMCCR